MSPTVTFATSCWEKDWRLILLDPDYLRVRQIANHCFPFNERLLVINNVVDLPAAIAAAEKKVAEGVLTRYVVADETIFSFFQLKRSDFNEWQYYNALAPLSAIYHANSDYLLYLTGDVRLDRPVDWVSKALSCMEKKSWVKVANPAWNGKLNEVRAESYRRGWHFSYAKQGFSDQLFLVRREDFRRPIYGEIRADADHYPRGDVFEKRVFSYMKNRGWERITFRAGSYTHENL